MLQNTKPRRTLPEAAPMLAADADDDLQTSALQLPRISTGALPAFTQRDAWLFGFGPLAGPAALLPLAELCIRGVAPTALISVQVLSDGRVVFRLDSVCDSRGTPLPAGELLLAMAQMQGRDAMVIDVTGLDLAPASTEVWLALSGDVGDDLPQVSLVLAGLGEAQSAS